MRNKAERLLNKMPVTIIANNGDEFQVTGREINSNVFTLDVMNITMQQKHGYNYLAAVDNGCVFEYAVKNSVSAVEKALMTLRDEGTLF